MSSIYEGHFVKVKDAFLLHHVNDSKRPSWFFSIKGDILFVEMDTHLTFFLTKDFIKVYTNFCIDKSKFIEIVDK